MELKEKVIRNLIRKLLFESIDVFDKFPAKYMSGMEDVDDLEQLLNKNVKNKEAKIKWAQTVDLSEPIKIFIWQSGEVTFNDGHHRVLAARILGKHVNIEIESNRLKPEIFSEYMDRINRGFSPIEINPDRLNLNYVENYRIPSLEVMNKARELGIMRTGTRENLFNFYLEQQENEQNNLNENLRNKIYNLRFPKDNVLVFVSPEKLLNRHSHDDPDFAILNSKNQIGNRVKKAEDFLDKYMDDQRWIHPKTGERHNDMQISFEPSIAMINNGKLSFVDGRHRILAAIRKGLKEVPLEVPRDQVDIFEKEFGIRLNEEFNLLEYSQDDSFLSNYDTAKKFAIDNINGVDEAFEEHQENPDNIQAEYQYDKYMELVELYVDKYNELIHKTEIEIYRQINLNSIKNLDVNDIGKHWSFSLDGVGAYGEAHPNRGMINGKPFILTGLINPHNIDWKYGFHSFVWYGEDQWECALQKGTHVEITKINNKELSQSIMAIVGDH